MPVQGEDESKVVPVHHRGSLGTGIVLRQWAGAHYLPKMPVCRADRYVITTIARKFRAPRAPLALVTLWLRILVAGDVMLALISNPGH